MIYCECDVCKTHREFCRVLEAVPEELHQYFHGMYDHMTNVSADLNYYQAVLIGKWPGSKEILKCALAKIESGTDRATENRPNEKEGF